MTSEPTWKRQGFKSHTDYQEHLAKQRGFKSISDYHKKTGISTKNVKQKLCKSLQKLTTNVKDTESLFADIEFLRNLTGCKIQTKKKISIK